jgi:hypothetical protein
MKLIAFFNIIKRLEQQCPPYSDCRELRQHIRLCEYEIGMERDSSLFDHPDGPAHIPQVFALLERTMTALTVMHGQAEPVFNTNDQALTQHALRARLGLLNSQLAQLQVFLSNLTAAYNRHIVAEVARRRADEIKNYPQATLTLPPEIVLRTTPFETTAPAPTEQPIMVSHYGEQEKDSRALNSARVGLKDAVHELKFELAVLHDTLYKEENETRYCESLIDRMAAGDEHYMHGLMLNSHLIYTENGRLQSIGSILIDMLTTEAESGSTRAMVILGQYHERNAEKNQAADETMKAISRYQCAANKGDLEAKILMVPHLQLSVEEQCFAYRRLAGILVREWQQLQSRFSLSKFALMIRRGLDALLDSKPQNATTQTYRDYFSEVLGVGLISEYNYYDQDTLLRLLSLLSNNEMAHKLYEKDKDLQELWVKRLPSLHPSIRDNISFRKNNIVGPGMKCFYAQLMSGVLKQKLARDD